MLLSFGGENMLKNLIGEKYGRLIIVDGPKSRNKQRWWKCKCDCGNPQLVEVSTARLTSGNTQSCGCLKKEIIAMRNKANALDLTNQQFGRLTAKAISKNNHNGNYWLCDCKCGNQIEVTATNLNTGRIKSCGCLTSKGEFEINKLLFENGIQFQTQYQFYDLLGPNGFPLRFDFAIFKNGILSHLVEYNGEQHYRKSNNNWSQQLADNDLAKQSYCQQHEIPLVIIRYDQKWNLDTILKT